MEQRIGGAAAWGGAPQRVTGLNVAIPPRPLVRSAHVGVLVGGRRALGKRIENAVLIGVPLAGSIVGVWYIFAHGVGWIELSAFMIGYGIIGVGTALGLHRYFSHKSFETGPILRFLLGAAGTMACQGSILRWVADHRRHHAHTDVAGDVHSPHIDPFDNKRGGLSGLLYAHVGWMFDTTTTDIPIYAADLQKDWLVMLLHRSRWLWVVFSFATPTAYGYALGGSDAALGAFLVGACLRTTAFHNVVWAVNSIGHTFGSDDFPQSNQSRNNWWLALLTFGDGWHNNHHYFPRSAHHGLKPGELDLNGRLIDLLERAGVVWNVVRVAPERILHSVRAEIQGQALLGELMDVVVDGGPQPSDNDSLTHLFRRIAEQRGTAISDSAIRNFIDRSQGVFNSLETMQGFAVIKPHGYAGDWEMLDRIYTRHFSSKPDLARWDAYFHSRLGVRAVRNRKAFFVELLRRWSDRGGNTSVLDVASGPGRDLFEYFSDEGPTRPVRMHCLDVDPGAIAFSRGLLAPFAEQITYTCGNAFRFRTKNQFDNLWCAGLFDYLGDREFVWLLRHLMTFVAPGGEVVLGNFSPENDCRAYMDFGDWRLLYRTRNDLVALAEASGIRPNRIAVETEAAGINLFLRIEV